MKKYLLIVPCLVLVITGCTSVTASGPGWTLKTTSFIWDRENVTASVGTNGVTTFHEDKSTPDQQSLAILTQAIIQMAGTAAK